MSITFEFSSQEVDRNLVRLAVLFPKAAEQGLGKAGLKLIQYALTEEPTPPIDTGFLRGSWIVEVAGHKVKGGKTSANTSAHSRPMEAVVGFTAPYAAIQHEKLAQGDVGFNKHGDRTQFWPGVKSQAAGNVGGKFLERKFIHKDELFGIVGQTLKDALDQQLENVGNTILDVFGIGA